MGLETASYIPELNSSNPVGATDLKSAGDDHLRLIKTAILGTFPNFVGTASVPKSISKTEDELNDCAEKAVAETIVGVWDFTGHPTINSDRVGKEKLVKNEQNGNYTLVLGDREKFIYKSSGASNTITIPANASVAFPVGTLIPIVNYQATNSVSIAITTDTLRLEGAGTTGTRTLGEWGSCHIHKVASTVWLIVGGNSLT